MLKIDENVRNWVFDELAALDEKELLYFYYRGDSLSSSNESQKYELLKILFDNGYITGKNRRALGNQNETEFLVRMTASGCQLLDDIRRR